MRQLARRLFDLERLRGTSTHEDWLDAIEAEDRGEPVDWSRLTPADPAAVAALAGDGR